MGVRSSKGSGLAIAQRRSVSLSGMLFGVQTGAKSRRNISLLRSPAASASCSVEVSSCSRLTLALCSGASHEFSSSSVCLTPTSNMSFTLAPSSQSMRVKASLPARMASMTAYCKCCCCLSPAKRFSEASVAALRKQDTARCRQIISMTISLSRRSGRASRRGWPSA